VEPEPVVKDLMVVLEQHQVIKEVAVVVVLVPLEAMHLVALGEMVVTVYHLVLRDLV
jgi:hypothetical protein